MCRVLKVHRSGYYAWLDEPLSPRAKANDALTVKIRELFDQSMGIYGSPLISISSAPMSSSGSVKLRYEKWLAVWGNAIRRLS